MRNNYFELKTGMIITPRYLYPPRPEKAPVSRDSLDIFRNMGYHAQLKYNDHRTLFSISPSLDGSNPEITIYGRHGELRKNYELSDSQKHDILTLIDRIGLDRSKWHYLDGGILHHKSKSFSDTIVIWDIIVADNNWLLGSTYSERYNKLVEATDHQPWIKKIGTQEFDLGYKIGEQVLIPKMYSDYDEVWRIVDAVNKAAGWSGSGEPAVEGTVLKNIDAPLKLTVNDTQSCGWMTRSRVCTGRHRN